MPDTPLLTAFTISFTSPLSLPCLSSKLVNSRWDITGQIRQTDYLLLPSPTPPVSPSLSLSLLLSSFHSPFSSLTFCVRAAQMRNKVAVDRSGSGRFAVMQLPGGAKGEGREGWTRGTWRKKAGRGDSSVAVLASLLPPSLFFARKLALSPSFSLFLFLSLRVCPTLFSQASLPSRHRLVFLWPHFLAGVINDLTDTLDERCRESVKQVVIKTDAISF